MNQQIFEVNQMMAMEVLEKEFQDVLNSLSADQSLDKFRVEYEKLHRALKVSQVNEKKLIDKCRELSSDITGNVMKIQTALKMTQEDSKTISYLKGELEKIYKILELSKEREEKTKGKIENLHSEIHHLNELIEKTNSFAQGPSVTVHDLLLVKEELLKEKEIYIVQI